MGGTKASMIAGAPRNLTTAQSDLVRQSPPPDEEYIAPPPPSVPARPLEPGEPLAVGPKRFAAAAERAGFTAEVVMSRGFRVMANGRWHTERDVASVRCARDGLVMVAACWVAKGPDEGGWEFDVAFGRRSDGTRRVTEKATLAKDWLEHGVDEHVPAMRDAALMLARGLGARLEMVRDRRDGDTRFLAPVLTELTVAAHLARWHRIAPGLVDPMAQHEALHAEGGPKHEHVRRPLGEPGQP